MPYIETEAILKAKQMDLLTYLQNFDPGELVHISENVYCTQTHDSLKISNGKWCWFSRGVGGRSALDYLIKVKGCTFLQAVEQISGQAAKWPPVFLSPKNVTPKTKAIILPKAHCNADIVTGYLRSRCIDLDIIDFCIQSGRVYESDKYHNAVFVGFDLLNNPRHATMRATGYHRYFSDAVGSDKHFSFGFRAPKSEELHLFESAIDLLSYATLQKMEGGNWLEENLLSLAGI